MDSQANVPPAPGGLIHQLIPKAMTMVGAIEKAKVNQQGSRFFYRGIDDIRNAMHPIMAELGIFCVPEVLKVERAERSSRGGGALFVTYLTMRFTFYAGDGSSVSAVTVGEAFDSGDKSTNKAHSVAAKYAYIEVFNIPTEDEQDTDADSHDVESERVTPETLRELTRLLPLAPRGKAEEWLSRAGVSKWNEVKQETAEVIVSKLRGMQKSARGNGTQAEKTSDKPSASEPATSN